MIIFLRRKIKLKSATKTDTPVSVVDGIINEVITSAEIKAIQNDEQKRFDNSARVQRLQLAARIVSEKFGLDDEYSVTKFNDKGKVVELALENSQFIVAVTIKNSEVQGMTVED